MKKGKGVLQIMKKKQTGKFMAIALTAAMLGACWPAAETMRQTLLRIRRRRGNTGCGIFSGTGEYACRGNTRCKRRAGDH